MQNFRQQSVSTHQFAMIPRAEIPRSSFQIQTSHKTSFDTGVLVPIFVDEVLPGDAFNLKMTAFARMATPLFPVMDNLYLDSFFFFVPNRLVWANWKKLMGEQQNPGDSISYVVPKQFSPPGGYAVGSLQDYLGLPTVGQVPGTNVIGHNALPLRAYNLIYNEWFRDQNLIQSIPVDTTDGPDDVSNYVLRKRGKRHDYFTSALPWPQKGAQVTMPLGVSAPIRTDGNPIVVQGGPGGAQTNLYTSGGAGSNITTSNLATNADLLRFGNAGGLAYGLYADLSEASAATINQLRQSFQIQRLLERDARGGTRYTEIVRSHFGVTSQDQRLQRPEYLGGGTTRINVNPIAQTSGTGADGQTTPLGNLGAMATALAGGHGFSSSFTEHGFIIGLVNVRADLTYQQGLRKMWSRSTRYDYYFPAFAHLGEQTILNKEIYCTGDGSDEGVFGYQERWAEYRHHPTRVSSLMKSTSAGTIDPWHLAQRFTTVPTLNQTFIEENVPLSRILAVGPAANGQQMICDTFFDIKAARPLPLYSVPGMLDRF